jgi:hypothetical protein
MTGSPHGRHATVAVGDGWAATALFIEVGHKRYEVGSLAEASAMYCRARDAWGRGGSQTPDALIVDAQGERFARISYNGRVWPPGEWTPGMVPLYDNRERA